MGGIRQPRCYKLEGGCQRQEKLERGGSVGQVPSGSERHVIITQTHEESQLKKIKLKLLQSSGALIF